MCLSYMRMHAYYEVWVVRIVSGVLEDKKVFCVSLFCSCLLFVSFVSYVRGPQEY